MQGADDELRRAKDSSTVPAAPLLPTSDPVRSDVGHWTGPVDEVDDVDEVEEVVLAPWAVVVVDDPDGRPVVGVDEEPDEHPAKTAASPTSTMAAANGGRGGRRRTGMASG
jgi:hypothetical protein